MHAEAPLPKHTAACPDSAEHQTADSWLQFPHETVSEHRGLATLRPKAATAPGRLCPLKLTNADHADSVFIESARIDTSPADVILADTILAVLSEGANGDNPVRSRQYN
jgi:hypothetical protein